MFLMNLMLCLQLHVGVVIVEMYLLLDFIPNHTSDQHPWFVQSSNSSDRSNDFRNYYVWTGSTTNWVRQLTDWCDFQITYLWFCSKER